MKVKHRLLTHRRRSIRRRAKPHSFPLDSPPQDQSRRVSPQPIPQSASASCSASPPITRRSRASASPPLCDPAGLDRLRIRPPSPRAQLRPRPTAAARWASSAFAADLRWVPLVLYLVVTGWLPLSLRLYPLGERGAPVKSPRLRFVNLFLSARIGD
jgi:hypothetical protein